MTQIAETTFREFKHAARVLRRNALVTLVTMLLLGFGIGANLTILGLYRGTFLREISDTEPERLAIAYIGPGRQVSIQQFDTLRDTPGFESLAGFASSLQDRMAWRRGGETELVSYSVVTPNYFTVLRHNPRLGRTFERGDEAGRPVIISHRFWREKFGGSDSVLGQPMELNGMVFDIVGVLGNRFRSADLHGASPQIYLPAAPAGVSGQGPRSDAWLNLLGRLSPGVTTAQARDRLTAVVREMERQQPPTGDPLANTISVLPASGLDRVRSDPDKRMLLIAFNLLLAITGLVLLMTVANVSGILVARGLQRRKEVAVRLAIGAAPWHIVRQLFTETLLLAVGGGVFAILVYTWMSNALRGVQLPIALPIDFDIATDNWVLAYAVALVIVSAVLIGLLPSLMARRIGLLPALQQQSAMAGRRLPLGKALVAAQVLISTLLLVPALLFIRSFIETAHTSPGFQVDSALTIKIRRVAAALPAPEHQAYYERAMTTVRSTPGVGSAASAGFLPLSFFEWAPAVRAAGQRLRPTAQSVGEDYFKTMGIPVLAGREFTASDCRNGESLAIINHTFARRFYSAQSPVGQSLAVISGRGAAEREQLLQIVGIVADSKYMLLGEAPRPALYRTHCTNGETITIVAQVEGSPDAASRATAASLARLDPGYTVEVAPMRAHIAAAVMPGRAAAVIISTMALVGLLLAMTGAYGALSYAVARRTPEIAIRMSIGATRASILTLVVTDGLRTIATGAIVGMLAAAVVMEPLRELLAAGIEPTDPVTYGFVILVMIAVGSLASLVPARRAMETQPVRALRAE